MHPNASAFDAREHWRRVLGPALDDAGLPTDRNRPPRLILSREALAVELRGPTFARAVEVAGGGDFLLYAVLVAALQVCLRQHSGARRIAIGSPTRREGADTSARVLPIIAQLDPRRSFRAVLVELRETLLAAYACQSLDPAALLAELGREPSESRHPFCDVVVRLDSLHGPIARGQHDIELDLRRTEAGLEGELRYREVLWDRRSMEAFFARFVANLERLLVDVDLAIGRVDGLPAAEREALLRDARGPVSEERPALVHELILARAVSDPHAAALVDMLGGERVTARSYAELARAARSVAASLQAVGVSPGAIVAVVGRRSVALIEGLLGALTAGAAYLPLDPDGPPERLAAMLRQAAPAALLVIESAPEVEAAAAAIGARVVRLSDGPPPRLAALREVAIDPEHPAYLLFTSGSTGAPKGVLVPHRGVVNYLRWAASTYGFTRDRPTPIHGAPDTDLGVTSLWGPLVAGATALIVEDGHGVEPLAELLHGPIPLGVVKLTPTHLAAMSYGSSAGADHTPPSALVIGGEALRASLAELWLRHDAPGEVYNEYGPTETTVGSTACRVGEASSDAGLVPIGRPIANTRVYVLTEDLELAPRGATGELYIGGAGVSHGYLGDAGLTAARFIPDPFADAPGGRLYRTGDLARDLGGGVLEFRGRRDEQHQIRGYRVELAEVEAALVQLTGVREAVAVARTVAQRTQIVAYLVPEGRVGSLSAIRRELRRWLSDAMMPGHFVVLAAIPRLPSGKLDRASLPRPQGGSELAAPVAGGPPKPSADPVVEALAEIWARVLGVPDVGPQDNFFDLGGDSILSVHVVAEARHTGLHLLLNDLFQFPTIAELAPRVRREVVAAEPNTPIDVDLPLLPIQRWWLARRPSAPHHFNQSLVLALPIAVDLERVEQVLARVVARHEALRVAFIEREGVWTQRLPASSPGVELGVVDLGGLDRPARRAALADEATRWQASMNLDAGELVRAVVFLGVDERPSLLLCIHHLAADAVTWSVLLGDLARAWEQPEVELPPPSVTPWAWAAMLDARVEAGEFEHARRFAERSASLEFGRVPASGTAGAAPGSIERSYAEAASHRLITKVPGSYPIRLDELLLAALVRSAAAWTKTGSVLVERELHGREPLGSEVDFSRAVGWFASLCPVVLGVRDDVGELLADVRAAVRNPTEGGVGPLALASASSDFELPEAPFLYNHLGRIGGPSSGGGPAFFEVVDGERGVEQSPVNVLPRTVVLDSMVAGDRLRLRWRWRADRVARVDLEALIEGFERELATLADYCLSGVEPRFRPSDFELAELDQGALDAIVGGLEDE